MTVDHWILSNRVRLTSSITPITVLWIDDSDPSRQFCELVASGYRFATAVSERSTERTGSVRNAPITRIRRTVGPMGA
ncbi:hypothetical protein EA473_05280 [Natrarchaeobius chitinivorans]|uniref:Uncharacterized protein n=1 Tax=Natrarchaeobius chitinivorans TaxID=1679083 RepID=A0A3N6MPR3_NATCH|nr:hypothetical protein EA473_05280 [Natrarchaeobius chitinivorans]